MRTADPKRNQRELDALFAELVKDSPAPQNSNWDLNPWFVAAGAIALLLWVGVINLIAPVLR